jgi:ribosome-associated protein
MSLRDLRLPGGRRVVPSRWLEVRFSRASGPGGQHVNKTETRVDLRLDLTGVEEVAGAAAAERVRASLASRLDKDGRLYVQCAESRDRGRNMEIAHQRLEALLAGALHVQKKRRKTKPSRGAVERRLSSKRRNAERKRDRSNKAWS